jgi:hypothetical protein
MHVHTFKDKAKRRAGLIALLIRLKVRFKVNENLYHGLSVQAESVPSQTTGYDTARASVHSTRSPTLGSTART